MEERFETFTVLINRISRSIRKIKNQEMAEYGLRSAHVSCLYYVYSGENVTSTDLCERCEEDKATISRGLVYLEENGFILCESKTPKRYKTAIVLTEKGTEVARKISEKIDFILEEICVDLSEERRAEFYSCLSIISHNLELCTKGIMKAKKIKNTEK